MVASLATIQSGLLCAARMVFLLHYFDDRPWRGSFGCFRGMGEVCCSRSVHSLEVPKGQDHSWIVLHVRLHVLVDLVSPYQLFKHMQSSLTTFPETAAGTLTTTPTFKLSTSRASPTLVTF